MNSEHTAPQHASSARPDGSLRIRGRNILDLRMDGNDLQAATVREYLCEMLKIAFISSSCDDLAATLASAGLISGSGSDDGGMAYDRKAVADRIWEAIDVLSAEPFRPIGTKTSTRRHLDRLQRRNS